MEQSEFAFTRDEYQVHTQQFEGPLDLLLHLIRKKKMDILDVRLSDITAEYLQHLEAHQGINPSLEGEFLMTAATLIYIKSRSLLPRLGIDGEESPEQRLLHTLIEYDKIQRISTILKEMESDSLLLWRRESMDNQFVDTEYELEEVTSFQLAELFLNLVRRHDKENVMTIAAKNYSIADKKREILELLAQDGYLNFTSYLATLTQIEDVLVSFFTLLELVKQKQVSALQKKLFADIDVWPQDPSSVLQ